MVSLTQTQITHAVRESANYSEKLITFCKKSSHRLHKLNQTELVVREIVMTRDSNSNQIFKLTDI